ncbi:Acetylcholinesterase [Holothuria leucospilota]|uniref:Carboxylic ester hydrolase n=1 Tax=Holothuria leucospilota TaxID=206669 RepID=A0A9Q1BSV7_HOLLE|nr:Acetylcholinesterase [Holothuria leucospilota]
MQADPEIHGLRFTNEELSEDCLFLDVIVPKSKVGTTWVPNDSSSILYTNDELIPGNLGLLDQQLALKWVNENIEAFGGDPTKVSIGGVSAGSASVAFHTLSPGSKGLFQNAIMQSGSPFDEWITYRQGEEARTEVRTLAKLLECSQKDINEDAKLLQCLMEAPAEAFIENIVKVGQELGPPYILQPGPSVDGVFLPNDALSIIEEGGLNGENYIVGTNGEEGTLFAFHAL